MKNIDLVLQTLEDFRSKLEFWGVNDRILLAAGIVALILFVFSLREVFCWFFQISALREEIRSLRGEIAELKQTVDVAAAERSTLDAPERPLRPEALVRLAEEMRESEKAGSPKFRLDH